MTRKTRRPRERVGGSLAKAFLRNAAGFQDIAAMTHAQRPSSAAYHLAIAAELALKAYLLDRGISDQWNKIHIGHDLVKALKSARRAGFLDAPQGVMEVARFLTPYYLHQKAEAPESEAAEGLVRTNAFELVKALRRAIAAAINWERDAA